MATGFVITTRTHTTHNTIAMLIGEVTNTYNKSELRSGMRVTLEPIGN
jgi:hypothetical protein